MKPASRFCAETFVRDTKMSEIERTTVLTAALYT